MKTQTPSSFFSPAFHCIPVHIVLLYKTVLINVILWSSQWRYLQFVSRKVLLEAFHHRYFSSFYFLILFIFFSYSFFLSFFPFYFFHFFLLLLILLFILLFSPFLFPFFLVSFLLARLLIRFHRLCCSKRWILSFWFNQAGTPFYDTLNAFGALKRATGSGWDGRSCIKLISDNQSQVSLTPGPEKTLESKLSDRLGRTESPAFNYKVINVQPSGKLR